MFYKWWFLPVLAAVFLIGFYGGQANAAVHEQVTCNKGTGVMKPYDVDPYAQEKRRQRHSLIETYLYVTCRSHHADSVQMAMVNDISLSRGRGTNAHIICSAGTPGYKVMTKVPESALDYVATFDFLLHCPAARVDTHFTWTAKANVTLRSTFRTAKPAYQAFQLSAKSELLLK